jgi:ribonucrease Y
MSILRRRKPVAKSVAKSVAKPAPAPVKKKPFPQKTLIVEQEKKLKKLQALSRSIILEAKDEALNIKNQAAAKTKVEHQKLSDQSHKLEKLGRDLKNKELDVKVKEDSIKKTERDYKKKLDKLVKRLEKISSMTSLEAKKELLEQTEKHSQAAIAKTIKEAEEQASFKSEEAAREILVEAIRAGATDYVSEFTVSTVKIPNEEIKSRIIGKEGRNIRSFEKVTGVDLIMDETPGEIKISSFNSTRREIAKIALIRLIKDGRIQPSRIEEYVEKAKNDLDKVLFQEGRALCQSVNLFNIPRELVSTLGRFKFRTSYGQNMIAHTLEVVRIGTKLAQEIGGVNLETIKLGCLFHDIGKVLEGDGSHVELGVKLLKKHNLPKEVVNAVEQHHEDVPFSSTESILVYAADAISGARSGARRENVEEYIERIQELEKVAKDYSEVKDAFAIQAGREVRVIVHPDKITDDGLSILAAKIRDQIRDNLTYPGTVKVNVIREVRVSEVAK